MKPTVVIATHKRTWITSRNIETLQQQTLIPDVVVVVSLSHEAEYFREKFPSIHVVEHPNTPLGAKWQAGIDYALEIGADPVILTGSDDILDRRFVQRACLWWGRGWDFVGVRHWYILSDNNLRHYKYLIQMPLGGGRVYSRRILQHIGPIFENKNRHLDDMGWREIKASGARTIVFYDPLILSVKGDWPVMNSAEAFQRSPNCELKQSDCDKRILTRDFNYHG